VTFKRKRRVRMKGERRTREESSWVKREGWTCEKRKRGASTKTKGRARKEGEGGSGNSVKRGRGEKESRISTAS